MKSLKFIPVILVLLTAGAAAAGEETVDTDARMASLIDMCDASAGARAGRHEATPLYDRLGGYEKIHALTEEIVRLHRENERFRLMMKYVDGDDLATKVADFMAAGTGGTATYTGRDMVSAHAHLELNAGDFLSAGGDVIQAMQTLGYAQEEIDEVVCILVSMKDLVVQRDEVASRE